MGRKHSLTVDQRAEVRGRLTAGQSVRAIANELGTTRQTIMRGERVSRFAWKAIATSNEACRFCSPT